jgi:sulfate transport system permease protein
MLAAIFRHAVGAQRAAGLGRPSADEQTPDQTPTEDPLWIKLALGAIALAFIAVVLVLPLVLVFKEALRKGAGAFFNAIAEPDRWPR